MIAAAVFLLTAWTSLAVEPLKAIAFEDIMPEGLLKTRAELNFRRLQEAYFQWPEISKTNFTPFPGDAIGRDINALTLLSRALHLPAPANLQEIMHRLPELQNADGYLGPKLPEFRANEDVLAAHNGLICGLSEYILWTKDAQASENLRKVSENLIIPARAAITQYRVPASAGAKIEWHLSGGDTGQLFLLLDGVTRTYEVHPSAALKATIEAMIARYRGIDLVKLNAQTHAMLSATTGILRWYEMHGRAEDLAFAKALYKQYHDLAMTETFENYNWFNQPKWTEACAVVDSFLLASNLWRLTGQVEYLADAHHILYNGLLPGQNGNGGFGISPCVGSGKAGQEIVQASRHSEAPFCCSMRGGEGLGRAIQYGYFLRGDEAVLAFYDSSTATLRFRDGACTIRQTTSYPHEGKIRLEVTESSLSKPKTLRFFIPPWAKPGSVVLTVRGEKKPVEIHDAFATHASPLTAGAIIELSFEQTAGAATSLHPEKLPGARRYFRGALLLGSESAEAVPETPLIDLFDPAKSEPRIAHVLFLAKGAPAKTGESAPPEPPNLAQSGASYRRDVPANKLPAATQTLFGALKHDRASALHGMLWDKPQTVTQVILQWPEDSALPAAGEIAVRWSVGGVLHETGAPGIIGNGRQWVYTLDPQAKNLETDNVVVAAKNAAATKLPVPEMTIVGPALKIDRLPK